MITEAILRNLIELIPFLLLTIFVFYIPGRFLLNKYTKNLDLLETLTVSYVLGLMIFVVQAVILGLLNLRILTLPFLVLINILTILKHKKVFQPFKKLFQTKVLLIILVLGIIAQGIINFPSGLEYKNGIKFWSSQGHDGLWHVAVMQEIKHNFPPQNPLLSGEKLSNYHYSSDIMMGEFFRIFSFFNEVDLYFRLYPILFSFLIGMTVYVFGQRRWNKKIAYWSMFFNYFAGSFAYWVLLFRGKFPLSGETLFWASQSNTILGNPPHTFGIILLTTILFFLLIWHQTKDKTWLAYLLLTGMALTTFKVSAGGVLIAGILAVGGYLAIFQKKWRFLLFSFLISGLNFLFLKLISPHASTFLILEPLWFPATMMIVRLGVDKWALKRQHYLHVNSFGSWCYLIWHYAKATLIFLVGNTGTRIIGFYAIAKKIFKGIDVIDVFMGTGMLSSLGILLIFVQKGIAYNLIQFMQIYFHLLGFFVAVTTILIINSVKNVNLKVVIAGLIILLTIPTSIGNILDFYGPNKKAAAIINYEEQNALEWVDQNLEKDAVILTEPFDKDAHYGYSQSPLPIHDWSSTTYVTVYSNREVYLSAEEQLRITDFDIEPELEKLREYFKAPNKNLNFVKNTKVDYIYLNKDDQKEVDKFSDKNYEIEFENERAAILSIKK